MGHLPNLPEIRKRRGYTQAKLAELLEVEQPTVQRWESGTRDPSMSQVQKIADVLGVTVGGLTDANFVELGPRLFVKGSVAAGVWRDAWEYDQDEWEVFTGRADVVAPMRRRFGLRIVGDSMDLLYPHGTIVECVEYSGEEPITPGKRVVVQRCRFTQECETTVKEYQVDKDGREWLVPRSSNPAFQSPFQLGELEPDIEAVTVIAIVVGSYRPE